LRSLSFASAPQVLQERIADFYFFKMICDLFPRHVVNVLVTLKQCNMSREWLSTVQDMDELVFFKLFDFFATQIERKKW